MTASHSTRWIPSGKANPCPICGRDKDGDCRVSSDGQQVICHRGGSTFSPPEGLKLSPEPIIGADGQQWGYTGETSDGRAATFTRHKPLEQAQPALRKVVPLRPRAPQPAPITGPVVIARLSNPLPAEPPEHLPDGHRIDYSATQWTEVKDHGERPRHRNNGKVAYSAGSDPWPLFGHQLIEQAAGQWIAAAEGPKCALWLQAGGLVAVSQPGHDHKGESIARRFRELVAAGVVGMAYLADNDTTGTRKAEQLAEAAALVGLPLLVLPASEVWPDLPQGGSIDDAPGSAADRVAVLLAAIERKQSDLRQEPPTLDDLLGPAKDGELRRVRADKLTPALGLILDLRFNKLTNRIERDGAPVDGDFLGGLYLELAEDHQLEVGKDRAIDAAVRLAKQRAYHPVVEYLEGLTVQLDPIDWASIDVRCFGGEDPTGWAVVHLQRQLIGLVARAMQPGCELHTCLVTYGDQGINKTSFWKALGGEWFSDSLGDLKDLREDRLALHSAWIHEWGEIDSVVGKRESETLKRFISCSRDDVRKPYGRGTEQLLRSCGLVGTTNRRDFIKDPTGNRRFPIITVNDVKLEWVRENRDRIWGSALAEYRAGTPWHYSRDEGLMVSQQAQSYAADDPLRDALEGWAEDHPDVDRVPVVRMLYDLRGTHPSYWDRRADREFMRQAGLALRSLGWAVTGSRFRYWMPDQSRTDPVTHWKRR